MAVEIPTPRFLEFQHLRTEKTFHKVNHFYIQKNLDSIARKVRNWNALRNGTLLVEVFNDKQAGRQTAGDNTISQLMPRNGQERLPWWHVCSRNAAVSHHFLCKAYKLLRKKDEYTVFLRLNFLCFRPISISGKVGYLCEPMYLILCGALGARSSSTPNSTAYQA